MTRKKYAALILVMAFLLGMTLSGCGIIEFQADKWEMRQKASKLALAYAKETYGGRAKVVKVEVGVNVAVFRGTLAGDALVTLSLDGEEFQVYVVGDSCRDNRDGLALVKALDEYFRGLYGLSPALEYNINVHFERKEFFASHPSELGYEYNFLDFDYHGQPLEEVLPLLDSIHFDYRYVDDGVSLDGIEFRAEDWGGDLERLGRVWISCFRCYDGESEVPLGIQLVKGRPVLMAEGMEFSHSELQYADLNKIAYDIPYLSLRERLKFSGREISREHYTITRMGNFWVSTQEGWDAEECFELRPCEPDWADSIDLLSQPYGVFYTKEELEGDAEMDIITRKALLPFVDARFETVGEKLCLRDGVAERIQDWEKPYSSAPGPVQVVVIPSLIYRSDAQMAMGKIQEEEDGPHHAAKLFTYYLDNKSYWMNGLSSLTFSASYHNELVLLRVME